MTDVRASPVTLSILINNLQWITEEMNVSLVRSAFSTNVKVRRDCSCAIYTRDGELVAQGEFIPVHLGVMAQTLRAVLAESPVDSFAEGDAIIHNDPYLMGSHLWDVMLFQPVFSEGELVAWVGNLAHHVDIGGSPVMLTSPSIFEEGLRIPPTKLMRGGVVQEDVLRMITANVRTPFETEGDILAQTAANRRGEQRLHALMAKYGTSTMVHQFEAILDYAEEGMRSAISRLPDGEAQFVDFMETDGIDDVSRRIAVKLRISGSDIYIDFEGTGRPTRGGINAPWSLTHSAAYYAVKAVVSPDTPTNAGAYRPIHLIRPDPPSIVDAPFPSSVNGCTNTTSQRVVDVIIGAFSKVVPERACACHGHWLAMFFVGVDPRTGRYSSYVETYASGHGAKHNEDGADGHQSHLTNTANAPIEVIEVEHPLKVEAYALVQDSGGPGKYRGGVGLMRRVRALAEGTGHVSLMRRTIRPYGLFGGHGGMTDDGAVSLADGSTPRASDRVSPGDQIHIQTSGGGGWGDPWDRDPERVAWDVLNGYVSVEAAREHYGCVVDPSTMRLNEEATAALRNGLRTSAEASSRRRLVDEHARK